MILLNFCHRGIMTSTLENWKMDQRTYVLSDLGIVIFVNENSFLLCQLDHRVVLLVDDLFLH